MSRCLRGLTNWQRVTERTVYALVADMIRALGLFDVVALWSDGEARRTCCVCWRRRASSWTPTAKHWLTVVFTVPEFKPSWPGWLPGWRKGWRQAAGPRVLDETRSCSRPGMVPRGGSGRWSRFVDSIGRSRRGYPTSNWVTAPSTNCRDCSNMPGSNTPRHSLLRRPTIGSWPSSRMPRKSGHDGYCTLR